MKVQAALVAFLLLTLNVAVSASKADLIILPHSSYEGFTEVAWGISADGSTVVGGGAGNTSQSAFNWQPSAGLQTLPAINSTGSTWARAASADGSVVVGQSYTALGGLRGGQLIAAVMWTAGGGLQSLAPYGRLTATLTDSRATGVSADGKVIVGYANAGIGTGLLSDFGPRGPDALPDFAAGQAFRWTSGTGLTLLGGFFPNSGSRAYGISSDGNTVVGEATSQETGGYVAAEWTQASGWNEIPGQAALFPQGALARAASADGSVIVGYAPNTDWGVSFRLSAADGLHTLPKVISDPCPEYALATSGDGSLVGGLYRLGENGDRHAFIWDPVNGSRDLNSVADELGYRHDGWTLDAVTGISSDGHTLVGYASNVPQSATDVQYFAPFIMTVPEPSPTYLLVLVATVAVLPFHPRRT